MSEGMKNDSEEEAGTEEGPFWSGEQAASLWASCPPPPTV